MLNDFLNALTPSIKSQGLMQDMARVFKLLEKTPVNILIEFILNKSSIKSAVWDDGTIRLEDMETETLERGKESKGRKTEFAFAIILDFFNRIFPTIQVGLTRQCKDGGFDIVITHEGRCCSLIDTKGKTKGNPSHKLTSFLLSNKCSYISVTTAEKHNEHTKDSIEWVWTQEEFIHRIAHVAILSNLSCEHLRKKFAEMLDSIELVLKVIERDGQI